MKRYKKNYRIDGWPIEDVEAQSVLSTDDLCLRLNEYEAQIADLKESLARCRHQASYSIGDDEALKRQLAKVREIVNEVLAP